MPNYKAPGVYVEEIPGARSISGVSTDIAAFVGISEKGIENVPTLVTGWGEFKEKFGGFIWNRYLPIAIYNFFAEGGARCYVVRTKLDPKTITTGTASITAGSGVLDFTATSPGVWSDSLTIDIVSKDGVSFSVHVLQEPILPPATAPLEESLSLSQVMTDKFITSNKSLPSESIKHAAILEAFDGFTFADLLGENSNLMQRINGTSLFLRVTTSGFKPEEPTIPAVGQTQVSGGKEGLSNHTWIKSLNVLDPLVDFSTIALPDCVDQTTYQATNTGVDTYEENWDWTITVEDFSKTKGATLELLNKCEEWKRVFSLSDPPFGFDYTGVKNYKTGVGDNLAINSTYSALYYPWLEVGDPYTGKSLWAPPSGQTLGRYAATDRSIGVWKAAAGVEDGKLLTARNVEVDLTTVQQETLNPEGIDAIRSILSYGICIYGARTTSLDPEWRYVPVRRLAIYIEQSLYFALQWVVFEPNSHGLWGTVTRDVTNFMTNLWRQGALFGTSAPEAFFVVCDASNNPPETRDEGILFIDVGFAPVKPAEFVVIRLSQMTLTA